MKKDQTTLIMVIVAIVVAIYLFKDKLGSFFSGESQPIIDTSGGGGGSIVNPPNDTLPPNGGTPPPYTPPGGMTPINKNPYHDVWLSRPISKRFPWIAPSFYEASGRAYGIEQNIKGGIANKVLAMMSTTNKNVKLMPDYTFQVTIPAKTNISKGIQSSFKVASVVSGGIASKLSKMSSSKIPALITSIKTGVGQGHKTPVKPPSGFIKSDKDLYHQAVLSMKPSIIVPLGNKATAPLTPANVFLKFGK